MELQWPLILFTTFVCWCAGTFSSAAVLALKGKGEKAQMPLWIISAVLLVIGGISVFMHLQHWERIFNGFGHLSSGITQELICIIVLAVVAIIYLACIRRGAGKAPKWAAILAIAASVLLVVIMGHSYQMEARPAWDSVLWIIALLGNACIMGPATAAAVCAFVDDGENALAQTTLIGSIINAVACVAASAWIVAAGSKLTDVGWYYDLTHPTKSILSTDINPFTGDSAMLMILGVIIIGLICPIVCAIMGKKSGNWKVWGIAAAACGVIGAVCLRMVFYISGVSLFMFY